MVSDCCGHLIIFGDICSECKEHCGEQPEEEDEDAFVQVFDGLVPKETP